MKNQHLKELAQFRLSNINGMDKLVADRDRRIAELESWVRGVEEAMISATDHAAAAERERDELKHIQELNVKIKQAMNERFKRAERERDEFKALAEGQSELAGRNAARAQKAEAEIARRDAVSFEMKVHYSGIGKSGPWVKLNDQRAYEKLKLRHSGDADYEFRELYTAAPPAVLPTKYADELKDRAELIEAYSKTQCEIAQDLGCDSDNESILKAIYDLKEQGAPPDLEQDVKNIIGLLAENEWAEHCTKSELGRGLECEITRLHDLRAQPQKPAPDGWKLVPVIPTWGMLSSDGCSKHHNGQECSHHENRKRIWSAMLAAAPAPGGDQ